MRIAREKLLPVGTIPLDREPNVDRNDAGCCNATIAVQVRYERNFRLYFEDVRAQRVGCAIARKDHTLPRNTEICRESGRTTVDYLWPRLSRSAVQSRPSVQRLLASVTTRSMIELGRINNNTHSAAGRLLE